jgi:hypothetical protein
LLIKPVVKYVSAIWTRGNRVAEMKTSRHLAPRQEGRSSDICEELKICKTMLTLYRKSWNYLVDRMGERHFAENSMEL